MAIVALLAGGAPALAAQGVTSAAVQGRITSETRGTVENAVVAITNTGTGTRQQTSTNNAGRYNFENVPPGGPYTLDVRAIGYQAASKTGIVLALGQRYIQDFELKQQVVTLEELTVVAATNPLINSARTGASQIVNDTAIQRFPLLGRNFTDLLRTSPQVLSGSSIGGQNSKFNTILIDGGVNNDLFGLSSSGTPGGTAGAKPLSVEALQEFQIYAAPFDIREGSFSGGLVNAITKSGTNRFRGSFFGYTQRPELVGKDTARARVGTFDIKQYGGTFGGPLIPNKLQFFFSGDLQSSTTPFFDQFPATDPVGAAGISLTTATRVETIIKTKYGFDPGGVTPPQNLTKPDRNLFGKLNYQLGRTSQVEVSYNYTKASQDVFQRTNRSDPTRDGWQLNNSGFQIANRTNTVRSKVTSLIGKANLEVLFGFSAVRDARQIPNRAPLIEVQGDVVNNYVAAGGERFSHGNELDQNVYEATANLTFPVLKNHQITIGTHNEFFSFRNLFANNRYGTWTFGNVDSLDLGLARRYEILLEARPGGFTARFSVRQLGGYIQDAWRPTDRLTLTGGIRYDVPFFANKPVQNPIGALTSVLGVNTGLFPSGNGNWSPRLGFNYDPWGQGNTILRGGFGLFSGRPPYVWMSNAYTNTGVEQVTLTCTNSATSSVVPAFTTNVDSLPQACKAGSTPTPPAATVNYFDRNFKFQQALKLALGVDQRLPGGVVGTFDLIRTWNKNQMYQTDDNLFPGAVSRGEGRQLYATVNAAGTALVRNVYTTQVLQVVHHSNKSADRSIMLTGQLQKGFANGTMFSAAYTWAKSEDLISLFSSIATSNLRFTPLQGTLANRTLGPAANDVRHKFAISGSANVPFGVQVSAIFTARSGTPYAYVYANDANGDGILGNDLFYVPRDRNDISLNGTQAVADSAYDRLNAFIASEPCLRNQRGHIMARGSCRNSWSKFVDVRLTKVIPTLGGQSLQISADVFNLANLLNKSWGLDRLTSFNENLNFLTLSSYDGPNDRGKYTVPIAASLPPLNRVQVGASRWKIQLGGKYTF